MAHVKEGQPAPDFELEGTEGSFRLSDHRGERVLLLFYPADNSPVCTKQFCSYRDAGTDFDALGVTAVGISGQGLDSHRGFAARYGLSTPLLADPDLEVVRKYGVKGPLGAKRATFLIDEHGIVRSAQVHTLGLRYESVEDIRDMLSERVG